MAEVVLVIGESGSGKSASLRNFKSDELRVFNVTHKRLPFKNDLKVKSNVTYNDIGMGLKNPKQKIYVIDDSQYLMGFEFIDKAEEKGYEKYTQMSRNFVNMVRGIAANLPSDVIVYLLQHIDTNEQTGMGRAKTVGKMIDNHITLEGLFTIVLRTTVDDEGNYRFITNDDPHSTAKSPMGMFEKLIDNDLKMVDKTIREYYDIKEVKPKVDKKEIDKKL